MTMDRLIDNTDHSSLDSLCNHFLIAMPSLNKSCFSHTITYLCDHNEDGAMGLVINHPQGMDMTEIFTQLNLTDTQQQGDTAVMSGGPAEPERGQVLHSGESLWTSTLEITKDIHLTASVDIIEAIANGTGPKKYLFALGYAGWGPGQLEEEIANNDWLTIPADREILFSVPVEERWNIASKQLGIDLNLISGNAGHA